MIRDLNSQQYQSLSEFRYRIRRFLRFSEGQARMRGTHPQQHQLLLVIKTVQSQKPTIGYLAERMQLAHHSTVELVDRIVRKGLAVRHRDAEDGRVVLVQLTAKGEKILSEISVANREKLQTEGRAAMRALKSLLATHPEVDVQEESQASGRQVTVAD
jgi:DNA-binding MarR family transcriptional regulator